MDGRLVGWQGDLLYQSLNLPVYPSARPHYRSAVPNATKTSQGSLSHVDPHTQTRLKPSTDLPTSKAQARLMPTLDDGWLSASTVQLTLCLARKRIAAWLMASRLSLKTPTVCDP